MARVRMVITITGTRNGVEWPPPGGVVDLPDSEAATMVRNGYVAYVEPETATLATVEAATLPKPRSRTRAR